MPLTTINVTQPHTLGVEEAVARLTKDGNHSFIKLTEVTVKFEASVPGATVTGRVVVGADKVTVDSDQLPIVAFGPLEWLAENRIQAALAEALK